MAEANVPTWARALLRAGLGAWPAERRRASGAGLLLTAESLVGEAFARGATAGVRETLGEAVGLVRAGVGLRIAAWRAGGRRRTVRSGDLRYALRTLRRSPGFTTVAVLTLALGLGANAAVLGLADRILFRPLTYRAPDELVLVWNRLPGSDERIPVAGPDAAHLVERSRTLVDVAFVARGLDGAVGTPAGAEHVLRVAVTPGFFRVLGVEPALGSGFGPGEGVGGALEAPAPALAILSDEAWRRLLGGDPAVVGRAIILDGLAVTVAGVMPPGFRLALPPGAGMSADADVWTPLAVPLGDFRRGDGRLLDRDSDNAGAVVARLAPGASLRAAREEMARIAADLRAEVPERAAAGAGLDVRPLHEDVTHHARGVLTALVAGAAAVLLVTCLNLGTLLLARGVARARERAVRAALGAARGHLVRQAIVEAVVLVGIGSVAASLLAVLAAAVLGRVLPVSLVAAAGAPGLRDLGLVLAPAAGVAALAAAVAALQAGGTTAVGAPGSALRPSGPVRSRARRALVTGEVALAVVLVVGAGLLLRTVQQLRDVRPGFDTRGALTFRASIRTPDRYRGPAERAALVRRIEEGILALPGVSAVGLAGALPLSGDRWTQPWGLPGQAPSEWLENRADFRVATSGTFGALGARLLEGRSFTAGEDLAENERVVVVDEILARRLAPAGSALERVIGFPLDGSAVAARVVGVVEHVRHHALEVDGRETIWVPYRQEAARELAFVVRAGGDPLSLAPAVRGVLRSIDPDIPVFDVRTLEAYVAGAVAPRRFALALLVTFAALGLACAAVGLYGVISWEVGRRTRDLGLRMAVGAAPERVIRSVVAGGLRLAAGGVLVGVALAAGFAQVLRGVVYGVGAADPLTWAAAVALVLAVTLLASGVPALRASRLDPARALRDG